MTEPNNPHDALFKQVFSNPESAAELLQAVLPPGLLRLLSLPTLSLYPGSFVDESLASSHSDLLFSVELLARPAFLYLLFEHKSSPDYLTGLQLLGYQVRIWKQIARERGEGKRALPLPVVIPLVFHHSEEGWKGSTRFDALFEQELIHSPELSGLVPRFRFILDDISALSDDALRARALELGPTLALWALRDARNPVRLAVSFLRWLDAMNELARAPNGKEALGTIFRYLSLVANDHVAESILTTLHTHAPQTEETIMTLAERWMAQGEARGKAEALVTVLEARGLTLSPEQRARVLACTDSELLDHWLRAAATAPAANDVFDA